MFWIGIAGLALVTGWLAYLTWRQIQLKHELGMLILQLQQVAGEHHIGGRGAAKARRRFSGSSRIGFRIAVDLQGFLQVGEHARPCRVVDLSESGCQVSPQRGALPLGGEGVLTIEFSEFGSSSSRVRVVREVAPEQTYGLSYVSPSEEFRSRCSEIIRDAYHHRIITGDFDVAKTRATPRSTDPD